MEVYDKLLEGNMLYRQGQGTCPKTSGSFIFATIKRAEEEEKSDRKLFGLFPGVQSTGSNPSGSIFHIEKQFIPIAD